MNRQVNPSRHSKRVADYFVVVSCVHDDEHGFELLPESENFQPLSNSPSKKSSTPVVSNPLVSEFLSQRYCADITDRYPLVDHRGSSFPEVMAAEASIVCVICTHNRCRRELPCSVSLPDVTSH